MKSKLMSLICKYGFRLCAFAAVVAPLASQTCKTRYYQPKEPDGLTQFADKKQICKDTTDVFA